MTISTRLFSAASRIMEGDVSSMAAQELEAVLLDDERTVSLQEGLALYAPGGGRPYVDVPELRRLITEALEIDPP